MSQDSEKPSHEDVYKLYKSFIEDEQEFNKKIKNGNIDWYKNIVDIDEHFKRGKLDTLAKSEPLTIKRVLILNAFEHIAAAERAQYFRKLDYDDYFVRRDKSFESDNKTIENTLKYFHKIVTQDTSSK